MISQKMKQEWEKDGWKYVETNEGFLFEISFPFMELKRTISVCFETQNNRNYYFVKTVLTNGTTNYDETLFIEMKEHTLIHKTLIDLKWLEEENKTPNQKEEKTLFDYM